MGNVNPFKSNNEPVATVPLPEQTGESDSKNRLSQRVNSLGVPLLILAAVLAILWIVELFDMIVPRLAFLQVDSLDAYGIEPRSTDKVWRIATAPFLHADFRHLIANSIPLLVLGYLIIIRERWHFALVIFISALISGLGVWLFADANTVHIGASGIVFGFMGYLLGRGFFERSIVSILFGAVALVLYGSIIIGVLPGQEGVSWLGHLFGLLGGVLAAYLLTLFKQRTKSKAPEAELQSAD